MQPEIVRNPSVRRRVMLVGLGRAGALALDALLRRKDVEIVAAVDPDPAAARVALPNGVPIRSSLLGLPPAEIAIVSTPTPSHPAVCEALLDCVPGLRVVLCEKPATLSGQQLGALIASARAAGVELRVLLHYAFGSEVLWLAEHLAELGDVASFSASFGDPYGADLATRTTTLVSSWADSGINALTVLARLLEPAAVVDSRSAGPETSRTTLSFTSGSTSGTGLVETNWLVAEARKRTSLTLADGTALELDHLARSVTSNGRLLYRAPPADAASMRYRTMIDAHLDDAGSLLDEATTIRLHVLLADGLAAQRAEPDT
jgi:predicted dehydrogenase